MEYMEDPNRKVFKELVMTKKWLSAYDECDICHGPIKGKTKFFVDGKLKSHSCWALMCDKCFKIHGAGLGCGLGQKYSSATAELLEGGCKDTDFE